MADVIQPTDANVLASPAKKPKKWGNMLKNRVVLVVLAIIVIVAAGLIIHSQSNKPFSYSNRDLHSYTFKGLGKNQGISFLKPSIFTKPAAGETFKDRQGFYTVNGAYLDSRLSVYETELPLTASQLNQYYAALNKVFLHPYDNLNDYYADINSHYIFVRSALTTTFNLNVTIGKASAYTNNTIKSDAWQFGVTAVDPKHQAPAQTGELVYILSTGTRYYFLVSTNTASWKAHPAFWSKVVDSIQINR